MYNLQDCIMYHHRADYGPKPTDGSEIKERSTGDKLGRWYGVYDPTSEPPHGQIDWCLYVSGIPSSEDEDQIKTP